MLTVAEVNSSKHCCWEFKIS